MSQEHDLPPADDKQKPYGAKVIVAARELTSQEHATLRSLLWGQLDHVSNTIPAAIESKDKDMANLMMYRRLLFQMIEGMDGIKFPESTPSLIMFADAYLSNAHIGAFITALSSIMDFCVGSEQTITDPKQLADLGLVKKFSSELLYSIIPETVVSAYKAA